MRLFIAVDLSETAKDELLIVQRQLTRASYRADLVPKDNFHCTLKFLGECDPETLDDIGDSMERAVDGMNAFELRLNRFGSFASGSRHTAFVSVAGETDALGILHGRLEKELKRIGFALEKRKFTPHITLARNCDLTPASIKNLYENNELQSKFQVNSITLYESVRGKKGMIYTPQIVQGFHQA